MTRNLHIFAKSLRRSGIPLLIIECALSRRHSELPFSPDVIHVRSRSIMWQKERLLNIAIKYVPQRYSKIAWVDADVLFENCDWVRRASSLLESYAVVQLFEEATRLPSDPLRDASLGDRYRSFACVYLSFPNVLLKGTYPEHGHTGFAWAARREFLDTYGLYDGCIAGSGDHVMAHAFCGDWESPCVIRTFGTGPMLEHFKEWCERMYSGVRARVGVVTGRVLHLWHGDLRNRGYAERNTDMITMGFNPYTDVTLNETGCWEWAAHREDLRLWGQRYFINRREDETPGDTSTPAKGRVLGL